MHSAAFSEIAETLHYGLQSLGYNSIITSEGQLPGRRHIVLGSNLLPNYNLPLARDAILYNLEQVATDSYWICSKLIKLFQRHEVWDYNVQNQKALETMGVQVARILPIGYVEELTRIQPAQEPDIDVLFFGSITARRRKIINQMRAAGLQVKTLFGVYGRERDALIGRAKLVLNLHIYSTKILEMVRISYLLANKCTVLSEHSSNLQEDTKFSEGVAFADYNQLTERACELIHAPEKRKRLAQKGFELISARPISKYLRPAITDLETTYISSPPAPPYA